MIFSIMLAGISSCYREVVIPDKVDDVFEMFVSAEMQDFIYNSRDTVYPINDFELQLFFHDDPLYLDEMRVRGKTSVNFQRKSYVVKLDEPLFIEDRNQGIQKSLSRFKLLAMTSDYTYIESRLAFGLMEEAGLMPLFYKFVELRINGATQGAYFLVEDPEQFFKEFGSEFILRRGYYNSIADAEYEPSDHYIPEENYVTRFREIYSLIKNLEGEELYEALMLRIDLQQYFRKMSIDYLIMNGDYTDELFLYSIVEEGAIRFRLIPWDYDDIFALQPHEVGRTWGTGGAFGKRIYETHQDVLNEIGDKLIFSIEDDLDYVIAKDSFLYARYEEEVYRSISSMGTQLLNKLFNDLERELTPFYNDEEVVAQSEYDRNSTSLDLWKSNMEEKQLFLEERLNQMKNQLEISK